mgnify:CR=1 FL=1
MARRTLKVTDARWNNRREPTSLILSCTDGEGFNIQMILKPDPDTDWGMDCHYMIGKHFNVPNDTTAWLHHCVGQRFDFEFVHARSSPKSKGTRTGFPSRVTPHD